MNEVKANVFDWVVTVCVALFLQNTETAKVQIAALHYGKSSYICHVADLQQFWEAFHKHVMHKDEHYDKCIS